MDVYSSTLLLEFPSIQPTMCRKSQVDAVVDGQIGGRLRLAVLLEVRGSTDYSHSHIWAYPGGYHALRYCFARSDSSIETPAYDICQPHIYDNFNFDFWVQGKEFLKLGPKHRRGGVFSSREAESTPWIFTQCSNRF